MHIQFDQSKCTKCGLCHTACGSNHIEMGEDGFPFLRKVNSCNDCGHCMAICPGDAVVNMHLDASDFTPMVDPKISYEQYLNLVRNRRSIRKFKKDSLKSEHIEKLLQSVRYIPTGSNKQSLKYLFITDPTVLKNIRELMAKKFAMVKKISTSFPGKLFVKKEDQMSLTRLIECWDLGEDPYLRDAPCLLIIYSEEIYFDVTAWDAGIAAYNLDLAAQTLGMGTLQNGFFVTNANLFKSIKKLTQLPKKAKILGSLCLGYPSLKYRKTINRKELDHKNL